MKKTRILVAWILCCAMVLPLFGCAAAPVETTAPPTAPPTTAAPTEPAPEDVYAQAKDVLDARADVSLEIQVSTTMTLAGETFSECSTQKLTYQGRGSTVTVQLDETLDYGNEISNVYSETCSDGYVYVTMGTEDATSSYRGPVAPEEAAGRYLPVVLLDATLYGSISSEPGQNETTITFAAPTAAESWAMPADAQLIDASGSAVVDASGDLTQMDYAISYQYGPAEYTVTYQSRPLAQTAAVEAPEPDESSITLQDVDAMRTVVRSCIWASQSDTFLSSNTESLMCQAAGVVRNQSIAAALYAREDDPMANVEYSVYLMDYSTNKDQKTTQEEHFEDGKYTRSVDGQDTLDPSEITMDDMQAYCNQVMVANIMLISVCTDVTCTDLGSLYLMEFELAEEFGYSVQARSCSMLFNDSDFLTKLASSYETLESNCYIAIDKYSLLPTAAGYYYEGAHTIDGNAYALSVQADQSIEVPAKGAYFSICEKMPQEEAPEIKPTPLFYHVNGENGEEMWLLGTIHVGDERTAYLPQEIHDAFAASDALALEINSKAFEAQLEDDERLKDKVSDAYFFGDGTTLESLLEEEEYAQAVRYMKATGNYNRNAPYLKPSLWAQSIENFYLRQGYTLHGDQGVEERLHQWAEELDKPIREVESSLFQIEMMAGYSNDLQLMLLEESIDTAAEEYWDGVNELYEQWCAGDEATLIASINEEVDTSEMTDEELAEYEAQLPLTEEYYKAMSYDRNEGMLKTAIKYLRSRDVVFYAVGLAHLLDESNGLVKGLRDAGYTVELVTFAGT